MKEKQVLVVGSPEDDALLRTAILRTALVSLAHDGTRVIPVIDAIEQRLERWEEMQPSVEIQLPKVKKQDMSKRSVRGGGIIRAKDHIKKGFRKW